MKRPALNVTSVQWAHPSIFHLEMLLLLRKGFPYFAKGELPGSGTHQDDEVLGGAGDVADWGQGSGHVLQSDGSEVDAGRQANPNKALGAPECPAVAGVDIWLWVEDKSCERWRRMGQMQILGPLCFEGPAPTEEGGDGRQRAKLGNLSSALPG